MEGFEFSIGPLPVLESLDLLPKVLEVMPSLAALKQAHDTSNTVSGLLALSKVFSRCRPFVEAFMGVTQVRTLTPDGKPGGATPHFQKIGDVFETLFAKQHMTILQWVMRCIEFEYGDFLAKARRNPEPPAGESA